MKKISKILLSLFILGLPYVVSSSNNVKADSGWEWATFNVIAGIATCDGSPDNCTKPSRPPQA